MDIVVCRCREGQAGWMQGFMCLRQVVLGWSRLYWHGAGGALRQEVGSGLPRLTHDRFGITCCQISESMIKDRGGG